MHDDDLKRRLRHFQARHFPRFRKRFRELVDEGQKPTTLFIGCSDSRVLPYLLTGAGPGELFVVRNVGNLVPIWSDEHVGHGTAAAVEYAVAVLGVRDIVVCGHSHCGAIRALYDDHDLALPNLNAWLDFARPAVLPVGVASENGKDRTLRICHGRCTIRHWRI